MTSSKGSSNDGRNFLCACQIMKAAIQYIILCRKKKSLDSIIFSTIIWTLQHCDLGGMSFRFEFGGV